jgi:pimeloyl-ACP methyl ester carboxylesterase
VHLNYKVFGQGEPLIILHGLFGMLDNWQTIAKKLAESYTVFIVDQRNHGRSAHKDAINYQLMAEDLGEFMDQHWIHEACLMGHSMGGKTVMQFAGLHPERVQKMIVVDMAPKAYGNRHRPIFDALMAVPVETIENRTEAEDILKERINSFSIRQFLLKNLSRSREGGYRWKMNLPVIERDYDAILGKVEVDHIYEGPALFIRGERSDYLDEKDLPLIREQFPAARMIAIPEAGHWVHSEKPEQFLDAVREFLAG